MDTRPDFKARTAVHRIRNRFRKLFRAAVSASVTTPAEIEDELLHVVCALSWEQS
jgi:hypothetical protein